MPRRIAHSLLAALTLAACVGPMRGGPETALLDQGWSDTLRTQFHHTPQGSPIMPYDLFMALEAAEGGRFAGPERLAAAYGMIPADGLSALNPDGLPIGLSVEPGDRPRIGMTCAACHTAEMTANGRRIRVEGAPARFDFDAFFAGLVAAVDATLDDPAAFARAAERSGADPAALRADLETVRAALAEEQAIRAPALASGPGRVDALTQIVNALAARDQRTPGNIVPPAAPTSYPPLWLASRLEFVQWNPIAASPIGRNGGQVLGVFGKTALATGDGAPFASTMRLEELSALEDWVAALAPPAWDEALMGPIDRALAAEGEALFAEHCAACHNMAPHRLTDSAENAFGLRFIEIGRVDFREVGTDPAYVEALAGRTIRTNAVTAPLFGGAPAVPAPAYFGRVVGRAVTAAMDGAGLDREARIALAGGRLRPGENGGPPTPYVPPSATDLKASPLAGVWATGPYLHNGSVPTVYELLSPPEDRRKVFWTGGAALDLERLGYVSAEGPGLFRFDTALRGNGNGGHVYPAEGLNHNDRMAVIEYLKTQ